MNYIVYIMHAKTVFAMKQRKICGPWSIWYISSVSLKGAGKCAKGHDKRYLRLLTQFQETNINTPEGNSSQYHHHAALCIRIWTWWQSGRPALPETPGNHRPATKRGSVWLYKGIGMLKLEDCTGRPGETFVDPTAMLRQSIEISNF